MGSAVSWAPFPKKTSNFPLTEGSSVGTEESHASYDLVMRRRSNERRNYYENLLSPILPWPGQQGRT